MADVSYLKIKECSKYKKTDITKVTKIENASNESNKNIEKTNNSKTLLFFENNCNFPILLIFKFDN